MAEKSLIPEELRKKVGVEWEPEVVEVDKSLIQRIAHAIGDANPLWWDEQYAKKSKSGGFIAPPALLLALGWEEFDAKFSKLMPYKGGVHGSSEVECYQPVRMGDTITITSRLAGLEEKHGKTRPGMVFSIYERVYRNQKNEVVARARQTMISYPVEGGK